MSAALPPDAVGTVIVRGLRMQAYHGVAPQEKIVGNVFEVDAELSFAAAKAMTDDDLNHTVSYAGVVAVIRECMAQPSDLVENVVYRIYKALCESFPEVKHGRVTLYKLHPPIPAELEKTGFSYAW